MKAHEFKAIEAKATGLANDMLPISIEELVAGENLTQRQRYRINQLIAFAKQRYINKYGTAWEE